MLVVNFDEWGGVFDHVPPANAPDRRWGLSPLSVRDATANNLATALALGRGKGEDSDEPKRYDVPAFVSAGCTAPSPAAPAAAAPSVPSSGGEEWSGLAELAGRSGYDVG